MAKKVDGGGRDSLVVEREQGDGLHAKEGCENRLGGSNVDEQKSDQGCEDVGRLANKDYGQTSGLGCIGAEGGSAHVASLTGDQVCKDIDDARMSGLGSLCVQSKCR